MSDNSTNNNGNIDLTPSTEWGFLCVSYQKNLLELELLNVKTDRAHRVTFSATGTDDVQIPGTWIEGKFYQKFKTKYPATFENFDNTLTMLTPESGYVSVNHIMRIGWLATITIQQAPSDMLGEWHLYGMCKVKYGSGKRTRPILYAPINYHTPEYSY